MIAFVRRWVRALRFAIVSAMGAGIDFLGTTTALYFGAALPIALAAGWSAGLGIGYLAQALWTFGVRPTWRSFLQFALNCAFLLPVRYVVVTVAALVTPTGFYWDCGRIFVAMCVTLVLNYYISRTFIFRARQDGRQP